MSKLSREELVWEDERLRNADKDVDENHRRGIERDRRLTEEHAARLVFDENKTDAERVIERLRGLMEFLFCPADELASKDLKFLKFRNKLMANYVLASLLRIYTPGVWYGQWCYELREHVVSRWEESSVKKSWEQRREKRAAEKNFKKDLKPKLSDHGNRERDHSKQKRDLSGKFTGLRKKNTDPW